MSSSWKSKNIFKHLFHKMPKALRSWKKHLSDWARCQRAIGGIHFTIEWRAETLQCSLEFGNFKPRLESCIFKCIFWLNNSPLRGGGDNSGQGISDGTKFAFKLFSWCSFFTLTVFGLNMERECKRHGSATNLPCQTFTGIRRWDRNITQPKRERLNKVCD